MTRSSPGGRARDTIISGLRGTLVLALLLLGTSVRGAAQTLPLRSGTSTVSSVTGKLLTASAACTATLVGTGCAISAAHCLGDSAQQTGLLTVQDRTFKVEEYAASDSAAGDLLLIKLKDIGAEQHGDSPVMRLSPPPIGASVTISGVGMIGSLEGRQHSVLRSSSMVVDEIAHDTLADGTRIATGFSLVAPDTPGDRPAQAACMGDSGGPVLYGADLVGVISAGISYFAPEVACVRPARGAHAMQILVPSRAILKKAALRDQRTGRGIRYRTAAHLCGGLSRRGAQSTRRWRLPTTAQVLSGQGELQKRLGAGLIWTSERTAAGYRVAVDTTRGRRIPLPDSPTNCDLQFQTEIEPFQKHEQLIRETFARWGCGAVVD